MVLLSIAQPRWDYHKVYDRLKLDGERIGREQVRLIRQREGLQVRKKQHEKRHPGRVLFFLPGIPVMSGAMILFWTARWKVNA